MLGRKLASLFLALAMGIALSGNALLAQVQQAPSGVDGSALKGLMRITTSATAVSAPKIHGYTIVWTDKRNGNNNVFVWDPVNGERPLLSEKSYQSDPAVHKDTIVWQDMRSGASGIDIFSNDPQKGTQAICSAKGQQTYPAISESTIVWMDYRSYSSTGWDIYGWNKKDGEFTICTAKADQTLPAIHGSTVVWMDTRDGNLDIYAWDPDDGEVAICTAQKDQGHPDVYGGTIVWQDYRSGKMKEIYAWDSTNGERVIGTSQDDRFWPAIHGKTVVWIDDRKSDNNKKQVYIWHPDHGEWPVAEGKLSQRQPDIHGNNICWRDEGHIYAYFNWSWEDLDEPEEEEEEPEADEDAEVEEEEVPADIQPAPGIDWEDLGKLGVREQWLWPEPSHKEGQPDQGAVNMIISQPDPVNDPKKYKMQLWFSRPKVYGFHMAGTGSIMLSVDDTKAYFESKKWKFMSGDVLLQGSDLLKKKDDRMEKSKKWLAEAVVGKIPFMGDTYTAFNLLKIWIPEKNTRYALTSKEPFAYLKEGDSDKDYYADPSSFFSEDRTLDTEARIWNKLKTGFNVIGGFFYDFYLVREVPDRIPLWIRVYILCYWKDVGLKYIEIEWGIDLPALEEKNELGRG